MRGVVLTFPFFAFIATYVKNIIYGGITPWLSRELVVNALIFIPMMTMTPMGKANAAPLGQSTPKRAATEPVPPLRTKR